MKRIFSVVLAALCVAALFSGCGNVSYAQADQIIIPADTLANYIGQENTVIVDMQAEENYLKSHIPGAVNIQLKDITVNLPVENMLAPKGKIAKVLGGAGIDNNTTVVIYDEGKSLNSARLWWSMLVYGHDNIKVVSGGLPAIQAQGLELTDQLPQITPKEFVVQDRRDQYLVEMKDVLALLDEPNPNVILLDTRSDEEYLEQGKIPGAVMYNYTRNFYKDGTYLDTQATRINYLESGIRPENEIILYCRTSMRAAVSFLRLYDAGYRNLKIYDGAFLEWSASGQNPLEMPDGAPVATGNRNNS
ncbi:MAG: sulfurtransferase [Oscillospiraceae bacterium]|jgi:thiosulfate/3-mercaptopyruvate sulfurtransferase